MEFIGSAFEEKVRPLGQCLISKFLAYDLLVRPAWTFIHIVHEEILYFPTQRVQSFVLVIAQLLGNGFIVRLQEKHALRLRRLFVLQAEVRELLTHILLQLCQELLLDFSDSSFVKDFESCVLGLFENTL